MLFLIYNGYVAYYYQKKDYHSHLKYIAFVGDRPVACLGLGSAAWKIKSRDTLIGWAAKTREDNLHLVANNTYFLILPWVSVKCLASTTLALNAQRISDDWLQTYNYPLYLLETFVEKIGLKAPATKPPTGS